MIVYLKDLFSSLKPVKIVVVYLLLSLMCFFLFFLDMKVGQERDGRIVDSKCYSMTVSHVRERRQTDESVETCSFFEVSAVLWTLHMT